VLTALGLGQLTDAINLLPQTADINDKITQLSMVSKAVNGFTARTTPGHNRLHLSGRMTA